MGIFSRTPTTDPAGLAEQLNQHTVYVLDVRQPAEWRHGHIRGSHNVPVMHLKSRLSALPRNKTIVTVCASGHRSNIAARTLLRNGFDVENLKGGMHGWTKTGLPIAHTAR